MPGFPLSWISYFRYCPGWAPNLLCLWAYTKKLQRFCGPIGPCFSHCPSCVSCFSHCCAYLFSPHCPGHFFFYSWSCVPCFPHCPGYFVFAYAALYITSGDVTASSPVNAWHPSQRSLFISLACYSYIGVVYRVVDHSK